MTSFLNKMRKKFFVVENSKSVWFDCGYLDGIAQLIRVEILFHTPSNLSGNEIKMLLLIVERRQRNSTVIRQLRTPFINNLVSPNWNPDGASSLHNNLIIVCIRVWNSWSIGRDRLIFFLLLAIEMVRVRLTVVWAHSTSLVIGFGRTLTFIALVARTMIY